MEKWIKNNSQKIFLLCAIFTMWCFYSIVSQGGSIIPRIEVLESEIVEKERIEKLEEFALNHTHYYNGPPKLSSVNTLPK